MASPTFEPPPSSVDGVLSAASFPLLWLLFPEVKLNKNLSNTLKQNILK
jgi:hypothetical protein